MNIGICTSFYNGYEKFLYRWAKSICKLRVKPSFISIVQSGPANKDMILKSISLLKRNRINYSFYKIKKHKGMGKARNKSVENCNTKWIMYLDVDDTIKKYALNNLNIYQEKCDVICGGLLIKNVDGTKKYKYFLNASRKKVLQAKWCCCSHAIYKRKFWEKSPYIENNDFVDYPLWLGFAQKKAVFMGIKKILSTYLRRTNGHHLTMTKEDIFKMKKQKAKFMKYGVNSKCLKRK